MIIVKSVETTNEEYKIYDIVEMENADGDTVEVKKLRRTTRQDEVEQRISQLTTEIERLEAEKTAEENVLAEIKNIK